MIFNYKFQIINHLFLSVFLCGLISLISAKAQNNSLRENLPEDDLPSAQNFHQWGAVSLFHGLPSDKVRAVAQDTGGVMWFGTDNGLAKYDGRRVQAVNLQGLNAEKIFALKADEKGTLWIGTDAGAARFFGGQFYPIEETFGKSIVSIIITGKEKTILASDEGQLFECAQTAENSLVVRTILPQPLFNQSSETASKLTGVAANGENFILGTLGHSLIVVENGEAHEIFSRPRPYFINALQKDKNGDWWFGAQVKRSDGGLYYAKDISRPQKIGDETGTVSALSFNSDSDLWVGTTKRGAFRFRGSNKLEHFTFENTAGGLRSNNIYTIFVDRENVVWFGTDKGVCRFDASSPFNQAISDDSNSNFVRTLYQAKDGRLFAGTNRGLFTFANGNWETVASFERKPIYAIAEDVAGNLLIGTSSGLFTSDNKQLTTEDVRAIKNFQGKTYIALFGRGIEQIEGEKRTLIFSNNLPTSLFTDNEKLWIGTAKDGVFVFDGKQVAAEKSLEKLRGVAVWDIEGDSENGLWFAAERGLFVLKNGELNTVANNVVVRDVYVNKNSDIWTATIDNGLFHVRFDDRFGWLTSNLSVEQGLPSQSIFALLPIDDENFLIGTNRGVVRYAPSQNPPLLIPTRILSQRLHNADELPTGIKLDYPQNTLTVEVTALSSRTFPEQFQYAFLLKNGKGEIINKKLSHDSQFLMDNLPPDNYNVEIRAFDKDLLSSAPLTFQFSVAEAPFPLTSTALAVLLAIALIALVWAIIERRRITKKNRELAAARFDLANEAERERRRIARDLHDQTLADLRNLMMMSDQLPGVETEEKPPDFRAEIEAVSNEIRRICEDLSPSVLENVGLTAALEFLLSHTFTQTDKKFAYKFVCEEGLEERLNLPPNVQMQIYRIAQEVLSNISRHSETELVAMKIADSVEDGFILKIENDGRDFDANKAKKGRGLSNIKARANLIEAEVSWQKLDGKTVFSLFKSK
ncbi:MAG: ligand-binding sensor domain-containing protein [Pyrinomonadaceae bacterium]